MEIHIPTAPSSVATTTNARRFSKTIAVTYTGMGLFGLISLIFGLLTLRQAVTSGLLLLFPCAVLIGLAFGFVYVMLALHQRRNWARHAAVWFWLLCLIWSSYTIVHNGLHPEPASGPLHYDNEDQLVGARFAALVMPYFMAVVELSAMYCLLWKASVVNQFMAPSAVTAIR